MNDKELLELAAKAAGIEGGWGPVFKIGDDEVDVSDIWFLDAPETGSIWDPLTDDGDALRLSVKLQISLHSVIIRYEASTIGLTLAGVFIKEDMLNQPADVAARRAIVRAAAEIARLKP